MTQHNIFTVKDVAQLAHLANKDPNDLIESIAHIHCSDNPTSKKEALAGRSRFEGVVRVNAH